MIKIIDGKNYDTAKSTVDKKFTYGVPGDAKGFEETLYVTDDGRYFIYTNGGAESKYTHEDITPVSREQVKDWLFSH